MAYQEISDAFWRRVEPLLEPFKRRKSGGSPPVEFRRIMNGIFYLLKTGCQWEHLSPATVPRVRFTSTSRSGCMPGYLPKFSVWQLKPIKNGRGLHGNGKPWMGR